MKMVSLKLSDEGREEMYGVAGAAPKGSGPQYPWGTSIELRGETLDALGIEIGDVEIDQEFTIKATCCVTRLSSSESSDGEPRQEMSLQIKEMAVVPAGASMEDSVKKILARRFKGESE
jgi:hypothetical protein